MMLYYILKEGLEDKNFIAGRTEGYDGSASKSWR